METPSEPAVASAVLLLACAAVAAVVAATARGPHLSDWRYWMLMSVALVALSADEAASLHELLVGPLRALVGGSPWLRYPLILRRLGVVVAAGVVFGRAVSSTPRSRVRSRSCTVHTAAGRAVRDASRLPRAPRIRRRRRPTHQRRRPARAARSCTRGAEADARAGPLTWDAWRGR